MYILAILFFIIVTYLLGESLTLLLKYEQKNLFEGIILKMGVGLGVFPLLSIILNWFGAINWKIVIILSMIVPIIYLFKKDKNQEKEENQEKIKNVFDKKNYFYIALILLFLLNMFVYAGGAFKYQHLEDGDPLSQALAAKYISETGTYSTPVDGRVTHYLEPYPPFFPAFNSMFLDFAQNDVVWLLKFMNALVISIGVFFFYFLIRELTNSDWAAIIGAIAFTAINSYVSHFIFSAGYATTMIMPAMLFIILAMKKETTDKTKLFNFKNLNWNLIILAAIICSSVFLIQPTTSGIFALFLAILWLSNLRKGNRSKAIFLIFVIGLLISQIYWVPAIAKYGIQDTAAIMGFGMFLNAPGGIDNDSSGGVIYSFADFMNAPLSNKIDQPSGVGTILFLTFILSSLLIIYKLPKILKMRKEYSDFTLPTLIWTLLLIVLLEGNALPYKFVPHRLWAYFSIGLLIVTIIGCFILMKSIKSKHVKIGLIILFVVGMYFTSFIPKLTVNHAQWPPGPEWRSMDELQGYLKMQTDLDANSVVYALCSHDNKLVSNNMRVIYNDPDLINLKNNYSLAISENYSIMNTLKSKGIKYFIVDTECVNSIGLNETNAIIQKTRAEGFNPVNFNQGFFLLEVV